MNASLTAKAIRQEIKTLGITAKVKKDGDDTVNIELINASPATLAQVKALTAKYKIGSYDGSIDLYVTNNFNKDLPQVAFIFIHNELDDSIYQKALDYLATKWNEPQVCYDDISCNDRIYKLMMNVVKNEFGRGEEFWASL